ncbi:MAG: class D sortase [Vicinamibacterales bacterium]
MTACRSRRRNGGALIVLGLAAIAWAGLALARAEYVLWSQMNSPSVRSTHGPRPGTPIGVLQIPRLQLTSVVVEGDDTASLLIGTGHLPDTPLPWQAGNSALAGHRDTDFRPLKDIRIGDVIRFGTSDVELEYVVRDTQIVEPMDISVLRPTERSVLTLITCYPFRYVGAAPKRFVVRAERVAPTRRVDLGVGDRSVDAGSPTSVAAGSR